MKRHKKLNKKAINKKVSARMLMMKGASASVLSSIILSSCSGYFEDEGYNTKDSVYGEFAPNLTRGAYVIEINTSNLSQEFINHIVDITSLIEEITTDKAAAISFRTAPTEFIAERGYNFNFEFSEDEIKILKAYTDDEVIEAINNNDFEGFITICKNKGYIGLNLSNYQFPDKLRKYFRSEEDLNNYLISVDSEDTAEPALALFVVAGAVVYIAGAVFIYGAVVTIAAAWVGVETGIGVTSYIKEWLGFEAQKQDSGVLRLWTGNDGELEHNQLYIKLIDEQTAEITEILKKNLAEPITVDNEVITLSPAQIESQSKIGEKYVRANLEGYYGLRKL